MSCVICNKPIPATVKYPKRMSCSEECLVELRRKNSLKIKGRNPWSGSYKATKATKYVTEQKRIDALVQRVRLAEERARERNKYD